MHFLVAVAVASLVATAGGAAAPSPPVGALTTVRGPGGCVYAPPGTGVPDPLASVCARGRALTTAVDVVLSPDGRNVYVAAAGDDAVASFRRDAATGRLSQLSGASGCIGESGEEAPCTPGRVVGVEALAVSPDGRSVYAAAPQGHALAILARDQRTGELKQLEGRDGCVGDEARGDECTPARALIDPTHAAVSPDGGSVYVASPGTNAVVIFARDRQTGKLNQLPGTRGCVLEPSADEEAVPPETCTTALPLAEPYAVAVSPDGLHVYVASSETVTVFARDRSSGAIEQLRGAAGCMAAPHALEFKDLPCGVANGLGAPSDIIVSGDGTSVYAATSIILTSDSRIDSGVAAFARDRRSGTLSQPSGPRGCVTLLGAAGCGRGAVLQGSQFNQTSVAIAISPDARDVYVAALDGDSVTVFSRDAKTSALQQLRGRFGCVGDGDKGCTPALGFDGVDAVAVSPDGADVYVASHYDSAVAVLTRSEAPLDLRAKLTGTRTGAEGQAMLSVMSRRACWTMRLNRLGGVNLAKLRRRSSQRPLLTLRPPVAGCSAIPGALSNELRRRPDLFLIEVRGRNGTLSGFLRVAA